MSTIWTKFGDSINTAGNAANDIVQGNPAAISDLFLVTQGQTLGGSNSGGSYFNPSYVSGIGPYEMPEVPELQPYKGIVWSPVPAGYRDVEHTISQMVNDPNSKYSQTLQLS